MNSLYIIVIEFQSHICGQPSLCMVHSKYIVVLWQGCMTDLLYMYMCKLLSIVIKESIWICVLIFNLLLIT